MTAETVEHSAPSEWPEGALYHSPKGLYPFQGEHIAEALVMQTENIPYRMFQWDTGLGKSHAAMALAAFLIQDDAADVVLMVCERGKLTEWRDDFAEYTRLEHRIHHGPSRKNKLAKLGLPQVLISTYETLKTDLVKFETNKGGRGKHPAAGPLMQEILNSGLRPMIIMDEADKLSNRTSANYKSWDFALRTFRKVHPRTPVYMLTATSIRKDWENAFNQLRLMAPERMPLVKDFESYFVRNRDIYGKARYHDLRMPEFADLARPLLSIKSKTDEDVRDQFPTMTEEAMWVDLEGGQEELYQFVYSLDHKGVPMALRQLCAHPASLVHTAEYGESKIVKELVRELGEGYLTSLPSPKTTRLVEYLRPLVNGQGEKAVVFTFFGPSVIPLLKDALESKGIKCWVHDQNDGVKAFRAAQEPGVLLASDAVARGINLPEASYLVEYDIASTHGSRTQRINRISRIGQGGPTATVRTMLTRQSIEIGLMYAMLRGNAQADELLGKGVTGDEYMTAAMRRRVLTEGM